MITSWDGDYRILIFIELQYVILIMFSLISTAVEYESIGKLPLESPEQVGLAIAVQRRGRIPIFVASVAFIAKQYCILHYIIVSLYPSFLTSF